MNMMTNFHFLRPTWLLALLPLAVLLWLMRRRRANSRSWQRVVDARLLPHLLIGKEGKQGNASLFLLAIGGILAIAALAGPAWRKLEQPVFRQQSDLVVALDLSRSMDAGDVKPSRLQRAELKLRDILAQQKEGDTALIVYAATPFVVSPLTSDANTIASQVGSMTSDLMPAQGARPDLAIGLAQKLLNQAGAVHGGVLLISDGIGDAKSNDLEDAIKKLTGAGHKLSILGVGTSEGAPVPASDGGFVKSVDGAILLPKLDDASLSKLAQQGGGTYRRLSNDDSDFHALLTPFTQMLEQHQGKEVDGLSADQWHDEGPWLLLPLMLLATLFFRRGYLLLFFLVMLPQAHPADAADWSSLWHNDDQRAQQALAAQQPQVAAKLFHDPEWRAAANYRAGNYQAALENLKEIDSAEADYNRGNALAKLGRLSEAITAYEHALKRNPKMEDARYNRELLEKMNKNSDKQKNQSKQDNQQQDKKDVDSKSQDGKQQDGKGQQKDNQQGNANDKKPSPQKPDDKSNSSTDKAQQNSGNSNKPDDKSQQQPSDDKSQQNKSQDSSAANATKEQQQDKSQQGMNRSAATDQQPPAKQLQKVDEQWLQRIPDDPGGLWRRKFLYQYNKQQQAQEGEQ
ncbi:MAG TPA: VWA domain-containing protein [Burkholderiaceae bacterium]|nr:VWA domain-containing protein [Burkholderiaceae bacterium]